MVARIRMPSVVAAEAEVEAAASWVENNLCLGVSRDETWLEEQRRASHHLPTNSRTRRLQNLKEIYDSRTTFFFSLFRRDPFARTYFSLCVIPRTSKPPSRALLRVKTRKEAKPVLPPPPSSPAQRRRKGTKVIENSVAATRTALPSASLFRLQVIYLEASNKIGVRDNRAHRQTGPSRL